MSERTYYVFCGDNCKFEGMTKEQILAAITQAVESHEISDVDTGFVTTLKEANSNGGLSFWVGTQAEYDALASIANNRFYIITDDDEESELNSKIVQMQAQISTLTSKTNTMGKTLKELDITHPLTSDSDIPDLGNYTLVLAVIGNYSTENIRSTYGVVPLIGSNSSPGVKYYGGDGFGKEYTGAGQEDIVFHSMVGITFYTSNNTLGNITLARNGSTVNTDCVVALYGIY